MELVKVTGPEEGKAALTARLTRELAAGKRVLWLIPGGSNIPISVAIMASLPDELTKQLTLALTDERYGPYNHADSNWWQLDEAGFSNKQATRVEVLSPANDDIATTTARYGRELIQLVASHDCVIGQFGMGADGHIAGILPGSIATTVVAPTAGYETPTFTRITATFSIIEQCSVAFAFVFGADKAQALNNLESTIPLADQPAQILKQLPEAYVYNDQIGVTP